MPFSAIFWTTYFIVFWLSESRVVKYSKETYNNEQEFRQDSLAFLSLLTLAAQITSLICVWFGFGDFSVYLPMFCSGIFLMFVGAILRQHCFKQLGDSFTIDVRAEEKQNIINSGAYQYIRHPGYLAGILMMLGFGVATANLAASTIMFVTSIFVYTRRIKFEELAMQETMGNAYTEYAKDKKRLLPFLY
jgi:protein-S-isoprenylcysteine O-methyltransferase Ste14